MIDDGGVSPGTKVLPDACATTAAVSTILMAIAPFGHDCTHAGASPATSRSWHRSHLRTIPRSWLYNGTSYGQLSVQ